MFISLSGIAAATAGVVASGTEVRGRFNYRTMDFFPFTREQVEFGIVTVNGIEFKFCWFADTEMGVVRTYDVFRDGSLKSGSDYSEADFPGREIDCPWDGTVSETLRGKVRIYGPKHGTHAG